MDSRDGQSILAILAHDYADLLFFSWLNIDWDFDFVSRLNVFIKG